MTKPQRKRLTSGRECERVQASGFSRPLFTDRDRAASVTAKVNAADNEMKVDAEKAGSPAFLSGRQERPVKAALPGRQLQAPGGKHQQELER